MSQKFLLRSFAGGEITPELAGRLDLVKYQTGLALCRNFITLPHGPAARRPGTEFIAEVKDSTRKVRLIPFTFNAEQTAVLELGHEYLRVHINGGALLEANQDIESIAGDTVTLTAHGYVAGDWIFIGGAFYLVDSATTDTFTITTLAGGVAAPAGTVAARVFTQATPYQEADLFDIHYAQSADVVTLTHPKYATRELTRLSEVTWSLAEVSFAPPAGVPTGVSATPTVAVNQNLTQAKYVVTAVADDGVTETLPSAPATATNNLTLAGNFNTITWNPVNGYSRYNVYKLRGGVYGYIGQVTPTAGLSSAIVTATPYQDIGFFKYARVRVTTATAHSLATGDSVYIDGTGYFDGVYTVTRENSTVFTYAKVTRFAFEVETGTAYVPSLTLVDDNVQADTTQSPPENIVSLNKGVGDYPSTTVYHEQRRWFAGTEAQPQVLWATRTGTDDNLTSSIPSRDADGMELRVASSQYNQIRHLVALSDLLALTAGGEFRIFSDGAPAITPTSVSIKPQGYAGASNVQPVVTSNTVMYVQAQGSRIRELSYSWEANSYRTADATLMAPHRFNYHTVVDLAFSRTPEPILWAVRDDGLLLGMTYVPDQQVYGWHAHDTAGKFESVTVVPEGNEDMLYAVVQRQVGPRSVRYIERLGTRYFSKLAYANYVDCSASFTTERDITDLFGTDNSLRAVNSDDTVAFYPDGYPPFYITPVNGEVWAFYLKRVGESEDNLTIAFRICSADGVERLNIDTGVQAYSFGYTNVPGINDHPDVVYVSVVVDNVIQALRISKHDPHAWDLVPSRSGYWYQTPSRNSVWLLELTQFVEWSFYEGGGVVSTRPIASAYRPVYGGGYINGQNVLWLPDTNGTIVYPQRRQNQNTRLVFSGATAPLTPFTLDLPTRDWETGEFITGVDGEYVRSLTLCADINAIYVLTFTSLIRVSLDTYEIVENHRLTGEESRYLAYDPARKYLFWFEGNGAGASEYEESGYLVTFDTTTGTVVSRDLYPPGRGDFDTGSSDSHLLFDSGVLWGGMYTTKGGDNPVIGASLLAMHV